MIAAGLALIVALIIAFAVSAAVWAAVLIDKGMQAWRRAHAVIQVTVDEHAAQAAAVVAELPEPYRVSDETVTRVAGIVFCPLCRPGGHGRCTCPACCGDRQCAHGPPALFSAEEAAWLEGLGISEGDHQ